MSNEPIINERIKSLEVSNEYHREALNEISNTLKEVVKIQSMLASQREEIVKIAQSIDSITRSLHDHDIRLGQSKMTLEEIRKDFDQLNSDFNETKQKADNNARFTKLVTGIVTLVGVPLVIAIITKILM